VNDFTKATILQSDHHVAGIRVCKTARIPIMQPGTYRSIPETTGATSPPGWFKHPSAKELPTPMTHTRIDDGRATALVDDPTLEPRGSPRE
jgi:hypothetical protein